MAEHPGRVMGHVGHLLVHGNEPVQIRCPRDPPALDRKAFAARVFRSLGARVEAACPDFSEVNDIVRGTRAVAMVAFHADELPQWRERMQKDLVQDIEQGLTVTAREIGHGEVLRSVLWHRVRAFMATRDLLILPTVAVPPFPVEQPYPTEINGKPLDSYFQWFYLTYGITLTGLPGISVPCGFTKSGVARRPPDRRPPTSGGRRPTSRRGVRGRGAPCGPIACLRWSPHSPQDGAPLPSGRG